MAKAAKFQVGDIVDFGKRGICTIMKIDESDSKMYCLLKKHAKGNHVMWIPRNSMSHLKPVTNEQKAKVAKAEKEEDNFEDDFEDEDDEEFG